MWAEIKQAIADTLAAELGGGVSVTAVADAEIPTVDAVRVLRAATSGRPVYGRPVGVQQLDVEMWVTDDDPAAADARLDELEEQVTRALEQIPRDSFILKVEITGIDPDGDLFRPTVGSRMGLRVNWRQRRD